MPVSLCAQSHEFREPLFENIFSNHITDFESNKSEDISPPALNEEEIAFLIDEEVVENSFGERSAYLAAPTLDFTPHFISDLDNYLMSDALVREIEEKYGMRLKELSFQQSLLQHNKDTVLQRSYYNNTNEERALYSDMAKSMQRHMLVVGLPKFLSSRKATRFLGEGYTKAVAMAHKATRLEFKSSKSKWKTGAGLNPFNSKAWLKYSNDRNVIEAFNYFDTKNSLAVTAFTHVGYYRPRGTYYVQQKILEIGFVYSTSPQWEYDYRTVYSLDDLSFANTTSYVSLGYRF